MLLGLDCCKSRENWACKRLTTRNDRLLVSVAEALSVETSSSPLSLIPKLVSGLAGIEKHVVVSVVARGVQAHGQVVVLGEHHIQFEKAGISQHGCGNVPACFESCAAVANTRAWSVAS